MGIFNFRPTETQDVIDAAQDGRLTATETVANAAAPQATTYTKTEVDGMDALKADKATTFTKTELTMSAGNLSSPLLDLPLQNDLSMKQGVGSVVFDRATAATYVDRYGVLKYASVDEPRFEKDGLLLEGGSTNLFFPSEDTTHANWTDPLSQWSSVSNSLVSPDGSTNADTITSSGAPCLIRCGSGTIPTGTYTVSFWFKAISIPGLSGVIIDVGDEGGGLTTPSSTEATTEWTRVQRTITTTTDTIRFDIQINSTSGGTFSIWGAQVEELTFASSYIPTTDSAVTRSADACSVDNIGNMPNTNTVDTNFAVAVDFKVLGISNTSQAFISQYYSSTNYWYMRQYPFDSRIGYYNESGNVSTAVVTYDQNKDITKIRRYIFSINALEQSIIDDGVVIRTDTRATELMTDNLISEKLYLGSIRGATNPMWGHLRNLKIYDKALTPTEAGLA